VIGTQIWRPKTFIIVQRDTDVALKTGPPDALGVKSVRAAALARVSQDIFLILL
jgi:hypothetical protein